MDKHIHIHLDLDGLINLAARVGALEERVTNMHEETKQLVAELNDATNAIAVRLDKLIANAEGGLTKEQAVEHNAELTQLRDHLRAMGTDPANPVPTPV